MTDSSDVRVYRENAPLSTIFDIRRRVFVQGQGVPESEEIDGRDDAAIQFLSYDGETPVGTARLREPDPGVGKVERVAVLDAHQGDGFGRALMETVEDVAVEDDLERLILHGQVAVEEFYRSVGYETTSDVYMEVEIPHVTMEKEL